MRKSGEGDSAPSATKRGFSKVALLNHLCRLTGSAANCQTVGGGGGRRGGVKLMIGICLEVDCVYGSKNEVSFLPEWSLRSRLSLEVAELDRQPFCGSPPPNAPLTTLTGPLPERCCGYFWRQWEASVTPLHGMQVNCSGSLLVTLFVFAFFPPSHTCKCVRWVHLHVRHIHLLAWSRTCASRVFAAEQTRGGKSNAVAVESYPWCRNHGNKAWKACDLIVISAAIQNSNP